MISACFFGMLFGFMLRMFRASPSSLSCRLHTQCDIHQWFRRCPQYQYVVEKCDAPVDDGECFASSTRRRNLATATMSSISQYRTNTERQRMVELGQVREVNVLWLLTLSAPEAMWNDSVEGRLRAIASSFVLP